MKRKSFLKNAALGAIGASALATGCTSEEQAKTTRRSDKVYRWKMVTTWPPNFPVLGEAANYLAKWIEEMSDGRLIIRVFGGGELVPALEAFDTVTSGTVEMGCGASYYWAGKTPAAQFFAAVPFGMNAKQMNGWLISGGGYELWKEVYAQFNLLPLLGGNTGVQMGGWFNKEINSPDDLRGLKMRIPGLGGKVLEKAGGAAVLVAGSEVYTSLERGVIDAAEWIGPYHDFRMGFHKIAKYYYYPGWHEPGSELEFFVNRVLFEELPQDLQTIVQSAALRAQSWVIAEFDHQNAIHLQKMVEEEGVQLRAFPQDVLEVLRQHTAEAIEETIGSDPLSLRVMDSYRAYMKASAAFLKITEQQFYNNMLQY
jgi:TRAP-type mannitol/chloroaromatic compound transport system substrate-binding protein